MAKEKGNGNWLWDAMKETGKEMVKETIKAAAERRAAIDTAPAAGQPERRRDRRRSRSQKENKELYDFVVSAGGKLMNWWEGDSEPQTQTPNDAPERQTRPSGAAAAAAPEPEASRPTPPPRPPPHHRQQSQPHGTRPQASAPALDDLDVSPDSNEKVEVSECCVCMDNRSNCVFLPCGHLVACKGCASQLRDCPLCRQRITRVQQVFFG